MKFALFYIFPVVFALHTTFAEEYPMVPNEIVKFNRYLSRSLSIYEKEYKNFPDDWRKKKYLTFDIANKLDDLNYSDFLWSYLKNVSGSVKTDNGFENVRIWLISPEQRKKVNSSGIEINGAKYFGSPLYWIVYDFNSHIYVYIGNYNYIMRLDRFYTLLKEFAEKAEENGVYFDYDQIEYLSDRLTKGQRSKEREAKGAGQ